MSIIKVVCVFTKTDYQMDKELKDFKFIFILYSNKPRLKYIS